MTDGYNIWTVERKPVSVHLRESVGAQIRAAANAPQESRTGLERGGLLWGRVRDTGENYYLISIEYAEHLSCDHERGEGWVPSEKDRRRLLKRLKKGYGDLQCVGYWRTHQRPGLYLDTRDLDLMATLFSQPWCVAMCVRPPSTAGFFLWENGDIHRTSSYREFELPDAEQPSIVPIPLPKSKNPRRWAAIAAIAAILAIVPFLLKSTSSSNPFNMLSMEAESQPGVVRLSWDPGSKVLNQAAGGVVWIADGADESKLELTGAQLRAGAIEYKPRGRQLNFRMQIGDFTESLRVANALPAPSSMADASFGQPDRDKTATERETAGAERSRTVPEAESAPVAVIPPPKPPSSARLQRQQVAERRPEISKVVATARRKESSPLKKAFGWIPGLGKKDYIPPRVVQQVRPRVSTERDTSVIVRVLIDSRGAVKNAALLTKGIDNNIGRSAVEAAKRWRFEPARADNRPVASDMMLRFQFEGTRN